MKLLIVQEQCFLEEHALYVSMLVTVTPGVVDCKIVNCNCKRCV